MENAKIIAEIDAQIGRLQQARQLLGGGSTHVSAGSNGRRAGSERKGTMSAAGRARISAAKKAWWAKKKKKAA